MGRRRRLAALVTLGVLVAGVVTATAAALRFTDQSYFTPEGSVGKPYQHTFSGEGGCGPALPYQYRILNGALPPGLTLSSAGVISGTPTQAGTYSFWVELSDEDPPSQSWCIVAKAQREFTINVLPGISINNQTAKPGTAGQRYSEQLTATLLTALSPPTGPLATNAAWSVASGQLPPGVTLGADGLLSGTPTVEGSYQFVVRAELDPTRWDTETLVIVVRRAVAVTAPAVPGSEAGVPFRLALAASGGTGPGTYTWSLAAGTLPQGVALAADGTIAGAPRTAGSFAFTARATDAEGRTADFAGRITVARRLQILARPLRPARVGRFFRAKLRTSGGVAPLKWRIVAGKLPPGVRLDRTLGVLEGAPKKPGRSRVALQATDGLGVAAKRTFQVDVKA